MGITDFRQQHSRGYTITEVLAVIVVLGVLLVIVAATLNPGQSRETAYETAAENSMKNLANAASLYVFKNNAYPPDADAAVAPELQPYVSKDDRGNWPPAAPWPHSYFDYEAWQVNPASTGNDTFQISIRFCTYGDSAATCAAQAPRAPWATGFNSILNAYYYCIKGYCRAHAGDPVTLPGYCINCDTPNHVGIKYPGEP